MHLLSSYMKRNVHLTYNHLRELVQLRLPLPTELFTFPLGLLLSLWLPPAVGWGIVAGLLLVGVVVLYFIGGLSSNRSVVLRSFSVLCLWGIALLLWGGYSTHPLWYQALLLASYLASNVLVQARHLWRIYIQHQADCLCLRSRILRAERHRFERILLVISIISLAGMGLCSHLCPHNWRSLLLILSIALTLFVWATYLLESIHLLWVKHQLEREVWLPVLNAEHQVIGRTPMTEPSSGAGWIPVVRLIATTRDMIYLENYAEDRLPQASGYDTPFTTWLTEGNQPEAVAQQMIDLRFCGLRRARPRFLLQYQQEYQGKRLSVYLFAVDIPEPTALQINCLPSQGRWWPLEHLVQDPQVSLSAFLASEYPYLQQTILFAHRLRAESHD